MADYVSRDDVKNALLNKGQHTTRYRLGETWELNFMEILEALDAIPAADIQPVKHGRWELTNNPSFRKCSECGAWWGKEFTTNNYANYCPHCGARMDLKEGETND